ncbi:hypothetical protein E3N88_11967 [Mikania micrantha]|uniref:Uncharacterized protein n=1 Tax=Mikania micrantha TaxID=192012 RepID=A0A5N6P5J3_9ASTR|nr:hypothetical protein E3N88_11967 [Mikania micrantha]
MMFYSRETGKNGPEQQNKLIGLEIQARRRPLEAIEATLKLRELEERSWSPHHHHHHRLAAISCCLGDPEAVAGDRDVLLDVQELTLTHYFITKVTKELMDIQRCTIGERALGPSCIPVFA